MSKRTILCVMALSLASALVWSGGSADQKAPAPAAAPAAAPAPVAPAPSAQTAVAAPKPSKFNEAPMLAEAVKAGKLPPVEQRIPANPMVIAPPAEVGKYGGTLKLINSRQVEWHDFGSGRGGDRVGAAMGWFKMNQEGQVVGELAERYELSADLTTWTIYFRKGIRWSDGAPFTADDIMFGIYDICLNETYTTTGYPPLQAGGKYAEITKVDDYTVRLKWAVPNPAFLGVMLNFRSWQEHMTAPKHYLSKWHPKYNSKADEQAKQEKFNSWNEALKWHLTIYGGQNDINLPRLDPWVPVKLDPTRMVYSRNPYFFKVDTAGNQLPYVDGLDIAVVGDLQVLALKVLNGEVDYAAERLQLKDYPLFKEKEKDPNFKFKVMTVPNGICSFPDLRFNLNYNEDPIIASIIQDQRFRDAFSLSLDRKAINEVMFFGLGRPNSGVVVNEGASFYDKSWESYLSDYNPQKAKDLLAAMGLTKRNSAGILLRSDGKPLTLIIESNVNETTYFDMMKKTLADVGIGIEIKYYTDFPSLVARTTLGNVVQIVAGDGGGMQAEISQLWSLGLSGLFGWNGPLWGQWVSTNGAKGVEPPQDIKDLVKKMQSWQQLAYGTDAYKKLGKEIVEAWLKNSFNIGVVGYTPQPVIVSNRLGNIVPPKTNHTWVRDTMGYLRETVYFKN